MNNLKNYVEKISQIKNYHATWFISAAFLWTIIDGYLLKSWLVSLPFLQDTQVENLWLLIVEWVVISFLLNELLVITLFTILPKIKERKYSIPIKLLKITALIILVSIATVALFFFLIYTKSSINNFFNHSLQSFVNQFLLFDALVIKMLSILVVQLSFQIGQKYTPGFFLGMLLGRYSQPRNVKIIIMFLDLKDSTPISEKLGHEKYFLFIRDFIYQISQSALANGGDIYQYVGDEVIITWPMKKSNSNKCIQTLTMCRKNIQTHSKHFKDKYGIIPEFRAGIHAGDITVGEIGVIKKEIAMSGEAMNMTARIRSACSELNQKQIVSEDYFEYTSLKQWQGEDLGVIALKGLEKKDIRLYALKI